MKSPWYRRIFPGTQISSEKNTNSEFFTTKRGGRLATSIGGTLTGRGANLVIVDDPMKAEDANSESARRRAIDWFHSTLISRLNNKADDVIIVVMQRLYVDDLAGHLLEEGGWDVLQLEAIAETEQRIRVGINRTHMRRIGSALHPERESLPTLEKIKTSMGSSAFSAQYQQQPIPVEGNMIKRSWIRYFENALIRKPNDVWAISWDTAYSASQLADYSVGTVWLLQDDNCYLVDLVRGRYDFPQLRRAVINLSNRWPGSTTLIEDKGSGTSLIQELRQNGRSIIAIKPDAGKVTRLFTVQPKFESGSVYFLKRAPWLGPLLDELLAFPNFRNDDQVDSISQALTWAANPKR
jgi:predicted phage terminase large subunit-like protein